MKLLIVFLLLSFNVMAQDNWKVKQNDRVVLKADGEDEEKNVVTIRSSAPAALSILLGGKAPEKDWTRSIFIVDANDNEVYRKDNVQQLKLTAALVKKLSANNKTLRVFTIALPNDPEVAARVRVRRVHLCTLKFI